MLFRSSQLRASVSRSAYFTFKVGAELQERGDRKSALIIYDEVGYGKTFDFSRKSGKGDIISLIIEDTLLKKYDEMKKKDKPNPRVWIEEDPLAVGHHDAVEKVYDRRNNLFGYKFNGYYLTQADEVIYAFIERYGMRKFEQLYKKAVDGFLRNVKPAEDS